MAPPKVCGTCDHAIHPPEDYHGRASDLACPEIGLVNEKDTCPGWEAKQEES
jgi:hypothetical protein